MICSAYLKPKRLILIDVDTQSHFFQNRSPMCVQNHRAVLANIKKVMAWAHARHIPMVSTLQVHTSHALLTRTQESCRLSLRKPACTLCRHRLNLAASDTMDWSNDAWLQYDQIILQKRSYDPFDEPRADRILTNLEADEFILLGAPVEGAVKATALGMLLRHKPVTIVTDAIGQLERTSAQIAWSHLRSKNIRFLRTERLVSTPLRKPTTLAH